ncbi:MAG: type II toxin-antitoxin system HipA family toxin [Pseudomonadota bacterium]
MTKTLVVLANGARVGEVRQDKTGKLLFTYDESWRRASGAYPLSLSMPLAASEHPHSRIEPFIWGLLPDNDAVLQKWAKKFQVSARSAFGLISAVGEDCAGAVQFVAPDRIDAVTGDETAAIAWLSEAEIAERLKMLKADHSAWRAMGDTGQFSLAGAQPKTALLFANRVWGVPSGRIPTTHILKPPTGEFDGHAENEHFCLSLAREIGLPTASSRVARFGDELAIVIERYDRIASGNRIIRVHQEDMCQALSVHPADKYEKDGGPTPLKIIDLLRETSGRASDDVATFIKALAFNWAIVGTDAHAKNYSVLIGAGGKSRLAPIYDVASYIPYDDSQLYKVKLAMKIGGEYKVRDIGARQWGKFADAIGMAEDAVRGEATEIVSQLTDAIDRVANQMRSDELNHPIIQKLVGALAERLERCRRVLN